MKASMAIRITPADVGRRVTLRSRLPAPEGSATTTDTVGLLRDWSDGLLHVERRDGTTAVVSESQLVAAKVIPDPPPGRQVRYPRR